MLGKERLHGRGVDAAPPPVAHRRPDARLRQHVPHQQPAGRAGLGPREHLAEDDRRPVDVAVGQMRDRVRLGLEQRPHHRVDRRDAAPGGEEVVRPARARLGIQTEAAEGRRDVDPVTGRDVVVDVVRHEPVGHPLDRDPQRCASERGLGDRIGAPHLPAVDRQPQRDVLSRPPAEGSGQCGRDIEPDAGRAGGLGLDGGDAKRVELLAHAPPSTHSRTSA